MKLKADFANLPLLYKTILCCDKWIPKKADVQIAFMPGKVKIFSSSQDGLYACAELNAEHILENYIIQSKNNDIIWMELQLQPFLACLKTLSSCSNIQIQLIKKDRTPYLQFQSKKRINFGASNTANNAGAGRVMGLAESPSSRLMQSETQVDLVHDVACKLLSKAESDYLVLPELPEFKIPIMLPSVSTLKTIIDRMKKLSDTIDLSVNYRGQLNISISNIHFNVSTYFRNLIHPRVGKKTLFHVHNIV
jgi:HUS1 checkpoint protein